MRKDGSELRRNQDALSSLVASGADRDISTIYGQFYNLIYYLFAVGINKAYIMTTDYGNHGRADYLLCTILVGQERKHVY